ncbi:MAG: recombinase family protein [Chloroflexi bacterium]|nr:recombinase family protein [Chloroflexota bacterium]
MCETCSIRTCDATHAGPPRVVAYVRCAAHDGARLAAQMARIQCRAAHRGWEFVRIYTDNGLSGNSSNRPGLQRLQHDIEAGLVDIVMVERFDRLGRNLQSLSRFVRLVKRCHTTLVSLGEGMVCQQL